MLDSHAFQWLVCSLCTLVMRFTREELESFTGNGSRSRWPCGLLKSVKDLRMGVAFS